MKLWKIIVTVALFPHKTEPALLHSLLLLLSFITSKIIVEILMSGEITVLNAP